MSEIKIYVDNKIEKEVERFLASCNINLNDAINIFLNKIAKDKKIPFDVEIPNKETIKAIKEARDRKTEKINFEELKEELKKCLK